MYCLSKVLILVLFLKDYNISAIVLSQKENDQKKELKIELVRDYVLLLQRCPKMITYFLFIIF